MTRQAMPYDEISLAVSWNEIDFKYFVQCRTRLSERHFHSMESGDFEKFPFHSTEFRTSNIVKILLSVSIDLSNTVKYDIVLSGLSQSYDDKVHNFFKFTRSKKYRYTSISLLILNTLADDIVIVLSRSLIFLVISHYSFAILPRQTKAV